MKELKARNIPLGGPFPDKATELSEVSITMHSQALEKGTQECPGAEQSGLHTEQSQRGAAQAPEKAAGAAFPSKHPSCHFPFLLACLFLPSAPTYSSTLHQLPLTGQVPLHIAISGFWWALAIFPCLDLLRFLMPLTQQELGSAEMKSGKSARI